MRPERQGQPPSKRFVLARALASRPVLRLHETLPILGTTYLIVPGVIAIAVMLLSPRGLRRLLAGRAGLEFFPPRRSVRAKP